MFRVFKVFVPFSGFLGFRVQGFVLGLGIQGLTSGMEHQMSNYMQI